MTIGDTVTREIWDGPPDTALGEPHPIRHSKFSALAWLETERGLAASVVVLFVVALVLRMLPVIFWPESAYPDETIQSVEQAHRLLFGYGQVPWEFEYAARSWLLAYLCAGCMLIASLFGDGPAYYLPAIGLGFATLSAASVVCAFLWARRAFGASWAFLAALVPLVWIDNIFFGARALSETTAAHVLIIALYLLFPGRAVNSRPRIFLGGLLLAAVAVLRMQLLPGVIVACAWSVWSGQSRRATFLPLSLGVAAGLVCDGVFDMLTWHYPFEPLLNNFYFNTVQGVASSFGTRPWWFYLELLAGMWGPALALMIPLIGIGARRMPVLFATSLAIFAVHCFIPHKDYRFIYPVLLLWTILAGLGLVQLSLWLLDGVRMRGSSALKTPAGVGICIGACWLLISLILYNGLDYSLQWNATKHDLALADRYISQAPNICGIDLYGVDDWAAPYALIHRRVPIYRSYDAAHVRWDSGGPFNVVLIGSQLLTPRLLQAAEKGPWRRGASTADRVTLDERVTTTTISPDATRSFSPERCFGHVCLLRRAGPCRPVPMTKAAAPAIIRTLPLYAQKQGVLD